MERKIVKDVDGDMCLFTPCKMCMHCNYCYSSGFGIGRLEYNRVLGGTKAHKCITSSSGYTETTEKEKAQFVLDNLTENQGENE